MELQTFIAETLRSIAAALDDVNHIEEKGKRIEHRLFHMRGGDTKQDTIHFDVAVTARLEGSAGGSAGGKITVLSLAAAGGEAKAEVAGSHERVSRIQFSVTPFGHLSGK